MKILSGLAAAALLAATAFTPAMAQNILTGPTGYAPGDIMVHASLLGVIPMNYNSHVGGLLAGDKVHASASISPEIDASYFITPHLSLELIAATTRHNVWVDGPSGKVKVGSSWVLPPTLSAQWHFAQIGPVRPYVGLGLTVAFFYAPDASAFLKTNHLKMGGLSTAIGPTLDAGFDVPITGNWTANVDVKQMFLVTGTHLGGGAVSALTELDPLAIGMGVGYKF
ncbi:OmpW family protein [Acidocella sp.]|uniref:OmpW/AlkL family protein n=1 Tax=Acidocella sp. TaxID=50710 RepID=UPI002639370E|nr:OmpW family outer membrane protein [Acidocella sp.]